MGGRIGAPEPQCSYLAASSLIHIAIETGSDAVYPACYKARDREIEI
tara:strand:+ start:830 stop:970 length:141 start_codon:yes stop_codon:yes gene_type:complete